MTMTRETMAGLMKDAAAGDMTARNAIADYMQENGKGSAEREAMGAALAAFLRLPAGEPGTVPPAVPNTLATEWPGFAFVLARSSQKDPWTFWLFARGSTVSASLAAADQVRGWAATLPPRLKKQVLDTVAAAEAQK